MSRRVSLLVMGAASALGFALLAWVSSAGSLQMLQTPTSTGGPPQFSGPTPQEPHNTIGRIIQGPRQPVSRGPDLAWVDTLLTVLTLSVAMIGVVLLVRWILRILWRKRGSRRRNPPEVPFEVLPEVALAFVNDAPAQFATLEEGSPRTAIVACSLRRAELAGEEGVASQTRYTSPAAATPVPATWA